VEADEGWGEGSGGGAPNGRQPAPHPSPAPQIYWYTVEFGVVLERGAPKAFGAGILSSPGEMVHLASGAAALTPFDPWAATFPKMSYKDGYQGRYFTLASFEEGAAALTEYAASVTPPDVAARFGLAVNGSSPRRRVAAPRAAGAAPGVE